MNTTENNIFEHMVKSTLDILVLRMLMKTSTWGFKLIEDIHNEFNVLLSPGTIYPLLYSLEEEKLIESKLVKRRKNYSLTHRGKRVVPEIIKMYTRNFNRISSFLNQEFE